MHLKIKLGTHLQTLVNNFQEPHLMEISVLVRRINVLHGVINNDPPTTTLDINE